MGRRQEDAPRGGSGAGPGGRGERERKVPRQARSRRTRRLILEAAVACFEEQGYDATTTAAIARRAGVAVGTLYGHFANKRGVLLELLDGTVRQIADHVVAGLDPLEWQRGSPRQRIRELIDAIFHAQTIRPGVQRILWERYFKDAEFRAAVREIERRVRGALVRLFQVLKQEGRLRVGDLATAAFLVHSATEWTASQLFLGDSDIQPGQAAEAATDMLSRYLFE